MKGGAPPFPSAIGGWKRVWLSHRSHGMSITLLSVQFRLCNSKNLLCFYSLLIEAESPHRVVHANAAFTQTVIGTSSNIQRWFVKQSSCTIPKNRSLKKALQDIIPNRDVHLVIYPVDGHEKVSHYLVETKDDSRKKRRRSKHDEPHRAIG